MSDMEYFQDKVSKKKLLIFKFHDVKKKILSELKVCLWN